MLRPAGVNLYSNDTCVQGTNDDAQVSKLSCAKATYFRDDFLHFFVRRASKRSPLINRGYYSRHSALRQLLLSFLRTASANGGACQVISLGAGFDTAWFQLHQDCPDQLPTKYLEVDFQEVTKRKASIISSQPQLRDHLAAAAASQQQNKAAPAAAAAAAAAAEACSHGAAASGAAAAAAPEDVAAAAAPEAAAAAAAHEAAAAAAHEAAAAAAHEAAAAAAVGSQPQSPGICSSTADSAGLHINVEAGEVLSQRYSLLPVNLTDLSALGAAIERAGLRYDVPTYVLSECVLVYMDAQESAAVVNWLGKHFPTAAMVVYEQVNPNDAFGRQMCSNLESRGCPLRGLHATPTLEAHCARMRDNFWQAAECHTMDEIYQRYLDPTDKARAERLEMFDEFEEWHMIQEHYSITVAKNDALGVLNGFGFQEQQQQQQQQAHLPIAD